MGLEQNSQGRPHGTQGDVHVVGRPGWRTAWQGRVLRFVRKRRASWGEQRAGVALGGPGRWTVALGVRPAEQGAGCGLHIGGFVCGKLAPSGTVCYLKEPASPGRTGPPSRVSRPQGANASETQTQQGLASSASELTSALRTVRPEAGLTERAAAPTPRPPGRLRPISRGRRFRERSFLHVSGGRTRTHTSALSAPPPPRLLHEEPSPHFLANRCVNLV